MPYVCCAECLHNFGDGMVVSGSQSFQDAPCTSVSRRTVHQYSPDVPVYSERLADCMFTNEPMMQAQVSARCRRELRTLRKRKHARCLEKALREKISNAGTGKDAAAPIPSPLHAGTVFDMRGF